MLRTRDTGYGSDAFTRVADNERAIVAVSGSGPRAAARRMRSGTIERAWYRCRLPAVTVHLTGSPAGRMIAEHLAYREGRRYRHRDAQGILWLPPDFADYTRGRSRQALRTNVRRARASGLTIARATLDVWQPGDAEIRHGHITPGPVERVMVFGSDGEMVGDSILSVDAHVALLHGTMSTVEDVRWLLNAAIIERLCGACELLLTNHAAMYRESYGSHHFQRLLGFDIARLRVTGPTPARCADAQPEDVRGSRRRLMITSSVSPSGRG